MTRTEEAQWWFDAVYSAIQEIPKGRVTSYGHIAKLLGRPERSRQVGVCLKHLPSRNDGASHHYHNGNVPWQRVINSKGQISPRQALIDEIIRRGPNGASRQAQALRREHVNVTRNAMGELLIDLAEYGWFPDMLPSEAGLEQSGESELSEAEETESQADA